MELIGRFLFVINQTLITLKHLTVMQSFLPGLAKNNFNSTNEKEFKKF